MDAHRTRQIKEGIQSALADFTNKPLPVAARELFAVLGYTSQRDERILQINTVAQFLEWLDSGHRLSALSDKDQAALEAACARLYFLFQLTDAEIKAAIGTAQGGLFGSDMAVDGSRIESYLVFTVELTDSAPHSRTELARLVRLINKPMPMPALVLFRHGDMLTLGVINRRLHKRAQDRDVLEKVTLIKDIRCANPHRAHTEILFDLSVASLYGLFQPNNFIQLHTAWQKTLDTSELNKKFYRELANWYFWAVREVEFPDNAEKNRDIRNATSVIRLITRLIFIWFVKEKELIPDDLFSQARLKTILSFSNKNQSTYYKAILQNLFFATLNTEMNKDKPGSRKFRGKRKEGRDQHYMMHNVFRHEDCFVNPQDALKTYFEDIPFLNGGLFECLDKRVQDNGKEKEIRIDGFSDHPKNTLKVPDYLFFSAEQPIDLNKIYGTKNKSYKVRGLIDILDSYKFTIDENTPIEEEIALDPELLGKVFENLLASYNPETQTTARKQTGSYYTPREIVNYMVDESLIAYLSTALDAHGCHFREGENPDLREQRAESRHEESLDARSKPSGVTNEEEQRLRHLLAYLDEPHQFTPSEVARLVDAIDNIKILDPACGSGAFPMGILHKLVHVLGKLDPNNNKWREKQRQKAIKETEEAYKIGDQEERQKRLLDIDDAFENNASDYGRKLYLIENCIFGVDIQPIAVQIAKLRFFISLVADQKTNPDRANLGVRPLPNLETKFVAANALIDIHRPGQQALRNEEISRREADLKKVRERHFVARTSEAKKKCRQKDAVLRAEIATLLEHDGWDTHTAGQLAAWDPYDQNARSDFFEPEWMFGEKEGFDITIGNPPYVRADEQSEWNQRQRQQILASKQYETLWEKWDLFVPFIERSFKLLRPGGVSTLIVSDAFCHAKYAQKPQNWFLQNSRILRLDFCSDIKIFDAGVHNLIYFFKKAAGVYNVPERRVHKDEFGNITILPSDEQAKLTHRAFFPEDRQDRVVEGSFILLGDICYISVGMVVHADEKIAKGAFELADVVSDRRDATHCRRFVEGKHLERWFPASYKWLEWGTARAPALFRRPTFVELYAVAEKIFIHRTAGEGLRSCFDDKQTLCNHTVMVCLPWHALEDVRNPSIKKYARYRGERPPRHDLPKREELEVASRRFPVKYLLGIMNSKVVRDYLRAKRRSNTGRWTLLFGQPDGWDKL